MANNEPERLVRPRVIAQHSHDSLPLEDEIAALLNDGKTGLVGIVGPRGSGKTTSMRHLEQVFAGENIHLNELREALLNDVNEFRAQLNAIEKSSKDSLVVYFSTFRLPLRHLVYQMAPWEYDDVLEYLVARYPDRCGAILGRPAVMHIVRLLEGLPAMWAPVLDILATTDPLPTMSDALCQHIDHVLEKVDRSAADSFAIQTIRMPRARRILDQRAVSIYENRFRGQPWTAWVADGFSEFEKHHNTDDCVEARRYLRIPGACVEIVARNMLRKLESGHMPVTLQHQLTLTVVRHLGFLIEQRPDIIEFLNSALETVHSRCQAMCVSVLLEADSDWRPPNIKLSDLTKAFLDGCKWAEVDLSKATLDSASLRNSDLRAATLDGAKMTETNLTGANLSGASAVGTIFSAANLTQATLNSFRGQKTVFIKAAMQRAHIRKSNMCNALFDEADLEDADLTQTDFTDCAFRWTTVTGANFSRATLVNAKFKQVNFQGTTLSGARFTGAELLHCVLEYIEMPGADFSQANLEGSDLTGSFMPGADFQGANLRETGLADIHWERSDLRDADLRRATFHMGSSRSGLVFSPIASEGSRTGYYTDESEEQVFLAPEEIRKANLRGADLRGANIEGVDFYLVDLRDAKYEPEQEELLRKSGAILESRV